MLEWLATRVEFVCLDTLWFCIVCSVPRYDLQSFALGSPLPTLSLSLQEQSRPSRLLRPPSIISHLFWPIVHSHRTSELVYRLGLPAFIRSPGRAGFDSRIRNTDFSFSFLPMGVDFCGLCLSSVGVAVVGTWQGEKGSGIRNRMHQVRVFLFFFPRAEGSELSIPFGPLRQARRGSEDGLVRGTSHAEGKMG